MEQDKTMHGEEFFQFELSETQKAAIDKELTQIDSDPNYLLNWEEVKQRYQSPK